MTISACLIVKDEEKDLGRCLASLQAVVDEIVLVDTGSSDRTIEIAQACGARVSHFQWCDDFSAARNESLRLASGDWLLWIDADEQLIEAKPGALRAMIADSDSHPWGFYLETHCPVSADEIEARAVVQQWRLFPNQRGIRFEGRIHEHPVGPEFLAADAVHRQQSVRIQHWGYLPDPERLQRKLERNRRLIELSIATDPRQPRHYFNLGQHYLAQNDFQAALPVLRQAIERWFQSHGPDLGYVPAMFAGAARAAVRLGEPALALDFEARTPPELVSSELLLEAGLASLALGHTDEAIERLTRAWSDPAALGNILLDRTCPWRALLALAEVYEQRGQPAEAAAALTKAYELAPKEPDVLERIQNSEFRIQNLAHASTPNSKFQIPNSTISACLIVKDEEEDLPRCLESLRGKVDEIVVVDTGSKDRTVQIAEQHGARVFHFAWCDDFSTARNESLRHATGDWIIWVDADDELFEGEPGALHAVVRNSGAWGYWVEVSCPTDEWGEGETVLKQPRLFRNGLGIHFSGRIHEQVQPPEAEPGTQESSLAFQDAVSIRHWGYIPSGDSAEMRSKRNRRLAELAIAESPKDGFPRYNLGLQLTADRDYGRALAVLEEAIALTRLQPPANDGYLPGLFGAAALAAVEIPRYQDVLRIERETPAKYATAELLMHAGVAWWRLGHAHEALARFQQAAAGTGISPNNHERSSSTWRPALLQACVYAELGQFEEAYRQALRSSEFAPTRPETLSVLAHVSQQLGRPQEALHWARKLLAGPRDEGYKAQARALMLRLANEADDGALALEALDGPVDKLPEVEAVVVRARAYALLRDVQRQFETLDAGCREFPENTAIRLELAGLLEAQGYDAEATNVLGGALELPDAPAELYQRLARLLARQGKLADASNALQLAKLKAGEALAIV